MPQFSALGPLDTVTSPTARADRWLAGALLLLLCWLPLPLGSNRDWSAGLLVLATGLLGLLWSLNRLRRAQPWPRSAAWRTGLPMMAALLLAQLWVAVQWLTGLSADAGATLQALLLGLAYTLLFALTLALFGTRRRLTVLLTVLVVSGTFQAFLGSAAALSGLEALGFAAAGSVPTGSYVNRNHLAGYLALCLSAGIGLLLALRNPQPWRWAALAELALGPKMRLRLALVIMVIALVMTHSRGGNTAFLAGLLAVGLLFTLRDQAHRRRNLLILSSIVLVDLLIVSQYFGLERLKDRVVNTRFTDVVVDGQVVLSANELRDDVVRQALPMIAERPLTGHGAGSFEVVFPRFAGADLPLHFDHAHNDYVQFMAEFGLLGSLPLAVFVLLAVWHALRAVWRMRSRYASGVGFGAAMGVVAFATHAASDFNLQIPANAASFVVLCAVGVLAERRARGQAAQERLHARNPGVDDSHTSRFIGRCVA